MIFVLGLCCGSFVNMLVYRTAVEYELIRSKGIKKNKKDSFLKMLGGRSFCDSCGKQLDWYENIPVISWVWQKGKTKCCQKKLSILYPITEVVTGMLFLIFNFKFGIFNQFQNLNFQTVIYFLVGLVVITFLVFSTVFDLKYMILPDFSTVILIISSLLLWLINNRGDWNYFLAAVGASGFLGLLHFFTKGRGMGLGDVKLAIFMGLFLGGQKTILAFYIAFIFGALISLILMILKKANKKTLVPFGPFLILGTIVTWFWGDEIFSFSAFQFFR